jgi:hypothetical protein
VEGREISERRVAGGLLQQDPGKIGARGDGLGMVAAQPLSPALQKLPLDGRGSGGVALRGKQISQARERFQPQIVVRAGVASEIANGSFEESQPARFARLPIRDCHLRHQTKGLGMVGTEPAFVGTQGREQAGKLGSLSRYTGGGLHGPMLAQT